MKRLMKALALMILAAGFHSNALAVNWSAAPLACFPHRAEPWNNANQKQPCHCPPKSYCGQYQFDASMDDVVITVISEIDGDLEAFDFTSADLELTGTNDDVMKLLTQPEAVLIDIIDKSDADIPEELDLDNKDNQTFVRLIGKDKLVATAIAGMYQMPVDLALRCCNALCPVGWRPRVVQVTVPATLVGESATETTETMVIDTLRCDPPPPPPEEPKPRGGGNDSCFIAGTMVTLADGSSKAIEDLQLGDELKGETQTNRVIGMETPKLGSRQLYSFNGGKAFVTIEHPFMTTEGWKSISPEATAKETPTLKVGKLEVGDVLIKADGTMTITSIEAHDDDASITTYNPLLDGDHTYYADDYLVHNKGERAGQSREGCLIGGTQITMADGSTKSIEDLQLGDKVLGNHGPAEIIARSRFTQQKDYMFSINGGEAFFTVEHPILTPEGWKSVDAEITSVKSDAKIIGTLEVGDVILMHNRKEMKVTSIEEKVIEGGVDAYNLSVGGDGSFIANGFIMKGFKQMQMHY